MLRSEGFHYIDPLFHKQVHHMYAIDFRSLVSHKSDTFSLEKRQVHIELRCTRLYFGFRFRLGIGRRKTKYAQNYGA